MITKLRLHNFRCFHDTDWIELAPITVLVGPNNSGKSAILQGLFLPAFTLRSEDPGIPLRLTGEDADYGGYPDVVFKHDTTRQIEFSFAFPVQIPTRDRGLNPDRNAEITARIKYGYLPRRQETYLSFLSFEDNEGAFFTITPRKYTDGKTVMLRGHPEESKYLSRSQLLEQSGFLFQLLDPYTTLTRLWDRFEKEAAHDVLAALRKYVYCRAELVDAFRGVQYLGPLRVPPHRSYLYSGEMAQRVGRRGERALQNYSALLKRAREQARRTTQRINEAFYKLGFVGELDAKAIGGRHYEFVTKHLVSGLTANLADTGFGASQVLPVLISLYTAEKDSVLLLEQPELHLHPAAQAELGSVFAHACSKQKRLLIETHSENMILRMQQEVAEGKLSNEDIRFYYVQPFEAGHTLTSIHLGDRAEFLDEWPEGFFEEGYLESLKLARARSRKAD